MESLFHQSQQSLQSHGWLLKEMQKIYDKKTFEEFWVELKSFMKCYMVKFEREPAVERVASFVCNLIISLCRQNNEVQDVQSEGDSQPNAVQTSILEKVFAFISDSHNCSSRAVRYRCCQLTNKLLSGLGDVMLDDELCRSITTIMLERTKDSIPLVREQAIYSLACLQNPEDENCPIIKAYMFHLENDSHAAVRRAIIGSIALLSKTLLVILDRTKDLNESVRCHTFSILSEKVNIRALSISQRLDLIETGLNDRSSAVKKICTRKLFQCWLRSCDGSFLELLYSLDVVTSIKLCEKLLLSLFEQYTAVELVKNFTFLSDELLINKAELDCEKVAYWKILCQYLDSLGVDGVDSLEKVLPNSIIFCDYLKSYNLDYGIKSETRSAEDQLEVQFIVEQLIDLMKFMDLSDIAARNAVQTLLHNILVSERINNNWISSIVEQLHLLKPDRKELMNYVCDLVNEIHEPVVLVLKSIDEDEKRTIDLKIASLRIKIHELRDELDDFVKKEDFVSAANVKNTLMQLEQQQEELNVAKVPNSDETTEVKNDPETLMTCLTIICETLMLKDVFVKEPTIEILKESIILPSIPNECDEVRNLGLKCLGLCCLNSKETAIRHLNIFLEACHIDVEVDVVKVTALKAIFDILLVFGIDLFVQCSSNEDGKDGEANSCLDGNETANDSEVRNLEESDQEKSGSKVMIALLCKQLDSEVCEIRTVAAEGLAKLLLAGRIAASKVLTRLILLWFNPLSEDNDHLRYCLGTFLPIFASDSALNQELLVDSFLPVIKTLCNAPASSPLSKVDPSNVCDLLIELTRARLQSGSFCKENLNHDRILIQVCNEILSNPNSFSVRPLSRVLIYLDLNQDSITMLKDLQTLMLKILSVVKDKMSLKTLVKFSQQVDNAVSACEAISRVNNIEPECETKTDSNIATSESETKTDSTNAMPESETKTDSNNAASKSQTKTDSNNATSESQTKIDSNNATSESQTKTDSNNATSKSQTKTDSNNATSESQTKIDSNNATSESQTKIDSNNAASKSETKTDSNNAASECETNADGSSVVPECETNADGSSVVPECETNADGSSVVPECETNADGSNVVPECETNADGSSVVPECETNADGSSVVSECETNADGSSVVPECETNADGSSVVSECETNADGSNVVPECETNADGSSVVSECETNADGSSVVAECETNADGSSVVSECETNADGSSVVAECETNADGSSVVPECETNADGSSVVSECETNADGSSVVSECETNAVGTTQTPVNEDTEA